MEVDILSPFVVNKDESLALLQVEDCLAGPFSIQGMERERSSRSGGDDIDFPYMSAVVIAFEREEEEEAEGLFRRSRRK